MKKIVVLTSGGDSPGMNAAIRAVVRSALYHGYQIFGCQYGFQGLVDKKLISMTADSVANCIQQGGTILKAERCLAFYQPEVRAECRIFLKQQGIDSLIVLGGNGSFTGAALLGEQDGPAIIGIPCTIDNDIPGTEYTIGFDTACNTALQAIDRIRDTASSHNRHFLVEVMGRNAGFLAVQVGIAGGAEIILIPEVMTPIKKLAAKIIQPRRAKLSSIIIVAEADQPGRSLAIAEDLRKLTTLSYRVCILGHTQRGGSPTTYDRSIASYLGYYAVNAIINGHSGKMVAIEQNHPTLVPFPKPPLTARCFTEHDLLRMNDILCG